MSGQPAPKQTVYARKTYVEDESPYARENVVRKIDCDSENCSIATEMRPTEYVRSQYNQQPVLRQQTIPTTTYMREQIVIDHHDNEP